MVSTILMALTVSVMTSLTLQPCPDVLSEPTLHKPTRPENHRIPHKSPEHRAPEAEFVLSSHIQLTLSPVIPYLLNGIITQTVA